MIVCVGPPPPYQWREVMNRLIAGCLPGLSWWPRL